MNIPPLERKDINDLIDEGEVTLDDMTAAEISSKLRAYGYEATPDWLDQNAVAFDEHIENLTTDRL